MNQQRAEQRVIRAADAVYRALQRARAPRSVGETHYAAWDRRAAATLLDLALYATLCFLCMAVVFTPLATVIARAGEGVATQTALAVAAALFLMGPLLAIPSFMLSRKGARNGQTPGKKFMKVRVVRDDDKPWTFWSAMYRQVALKAGLPVTIQVLCAAAGLALDRTDVPALQALAVGVTTAGLVCIGVFALWPLFSRDRRGLHDRLASSRVVNTPDES